MDLTVSTETNRRLVVLLPACLAGSLDLAQKVHRLALAGGYDILYLTLVDDEENMLATSRSMVTMTAATSDARMSVTAQQVNSGRWFSTLRDVFRPGDTIVYQAEQTVKTGFLRAVPIGGFLESSFAAPLMALSGYYHPVRVQAGRWLQALLFWTGCLAILIGFSVVEVEMSHAVHGAARTALLVLALFIECGALWAWTSMTNR